MGHTGTVRVLVVEDEVRLAQAVRRGLPAEGFVVDLAHDGEDGLHLAREGGVRRRGARRDAARAQRLPGVPGAAGRAQLGAGAHAVGQGRRVRRGRRARRRRRRLPDQAVLLRGAGSPGCVPCCAAAPGRARPCSSAGDLRLDPAARPVPERGRDRVDRQGVRAARVLMRRRGEVVPKTETAEHVWDANEVAPQRGRGLRRLPAAQDRRAVRRGGLQTVRGVGYRLAADGG